MSKILLVVGESGSGKSIITSMCERFYDLKSIQSYTTREKREPREGGHIFVTDDEFNRITKENNIVAYTEFDGERYCATGKQVEENDVYVIDLKGIEYFKEHYKGDKTPVVIYIKSPEYVRKYRMYGQDRKATDVERRISSDKIEFANVMDYADVVIENGKDDDAIVLAKKLWLEFIK